MSIFGAMNTSGTGMSTMRSWLDVLANNIANVNTVRPTSEKAFQASYVEVAEIAGDTRHRRRRQRASRWPTCVRAAPRAA